MARPIAFVVMPFGRKPTGLRRAGTPSQVDFDALWEKVYRPVLDAKGFNPVRADRDVGALIVMQMIQRLTQADLIVADVTLPNANVYYEIGVRHAAKATGCVLTSADWARPVFDLAQMRQIRFPLTDGGVDDTTAVTASTAVGDGLDALRDGLSPVFDAVPGYPGPVDPGGLSAFKDFAAELSEFQAEARGVRAAPTADRSALATALVATYGQSPVMIDSVALELVLLLRDCVGWDEMLAYLSTLPDLVQRHPVMKEQAYLAMAEAGDPGGLGGLAQLVDEAESSERRGLLGGRYKRLWAHAADDDAKKPTYLGQAIKQYELGMLADLNDYYPSSNLPRLYRSRRAPDDEAKAQIAATIALAACRRARKRGVDDGWLPATLLGAAFDAGDVDEAQELLEEIRASDPAAWKLRSTVADLRVSVGLQVDAGTSAQLRLVLDQLEAMAGPP